MADLSHSQDSKGFTHYAALFLKLFTDIRASEVRLTLALFATVFFMLAKTGRVISLERASYGFTFKNMTNNQKQTPRRIFKPLLAIGLGLSLIGCSPAETDPAHHDEESHTASHAEEKPQKTVTETHEDEDHHEDEVHETHSTVRSAESHTHGGAKLAIVSENNGIAIEFETPLYNLLGFEYAPKSEAEKTRVIEVENTLTNPQSLISFNKDAECAFLPFKTEVKLFDDHADDHDDEDHDEDHHDEDTSVNHKDVILNYELTCKAIDNLKSVHVKFFDVFSNFTELELVYLGPSKQMSAELSPSRPNADLN